MELLVDDEDDELDELELEVLVDEADVEVLVGTGVDSGAAKINKIKGKSRKGFENAHYHLLVQQLH